VYGTGTLSARTILCHYNEEIYGFAQSEL